MFADLFLVTLICSLAINSIPCSFPRSLDLLSADFVVNPQPRATTYTYAWIASAVKFPNFYQPVSSPYLYIFPLVSYTWLRVYTIDREVAIPSSSEYLVIK